MRFLQPVFSVILGLSLGLLVTVFAGENPWHVLTILAKGAFGTRYDLGMTLFYTTPLIFTGLSVAVAFRAGLFNIGAEGQLVMGSLAVGCVGALFPNVPAWLAPILAVLAALIGGGAWGSLPGWLKARRGAHEVITTIMLNFVAAGLASYITVYLLKDPGSQMAETIPVGEAYRLSRFGIFGGDAPVTFALILALVCAVLVWLLLWKTVLGYEIRSVGENESAARAAGIRTGQAQTLAMTIAGALAGLVGIGEVLGNAGNFKLGFSPDYGFTGIAVALLGRNQPVGVVLAAFLFGALHKGSADLDFETENITRDVSFILQAMVILCVSADGLWDWTRRRARMSAPTHDPTGFPDSAQENAQKGTPKDIKARKKKWKPGTI